jgi:hypothetical protein
MGTVYAISSGEYSDYSVERIFERKEDAEKYIAAMGNTGYRALEVEEFEFHPAGDVPTVYTSYYASIHPEQYDEIRQSSERTTTKPEHCASGLDEPGMVWIFASGPDRERVLKSVSDRLAKWKAQREGIA